MISNLKKADLASYDLNLEKRDIANYDLNMKMSDTFPCESEPSKGWKFKSFLCTDY